MPDAIKAACVQMTSGPGIHENIKTAEGFIREAAGQGAQLIATPEMTDSIRRYFKDKYESASDEPAQHFANLAGELGVWLLVGSMGVKVGGQKLANRSMLFSPKGELHAYYDKIHMFDVTLSRAEFYTESKDYEAGKRAVVADCSFPTSPCDLIAGSSQLLRDSAVEPQGDSFRLGMGVCYDVRFPHLWRDLAKASAQILSVPAAFTVPTGEAHWEVLLRARAIETGSFVIAPAQVGEHEAGRKTWGHSMIIGPWGEILAEKNGGQGIITAELNLDEVEKARKSIPALTHDRDYTLVKI